MRKGVGVEDSAGTQRLVSMFCTVVVMESFVACYCYSAFVQESTHHIHSKTGVTCNSSNLRLVHPAAFKKNSSRSTFLAPHSLLCSNPLSPPSTMDSQPIASTSTLPPLPSANNERQIAIRLSTKDTAYSIPSTKFLVPSSWRRFHLSELINKVLENCEYCLLAA